MTTIRFGDTRHGPSAPEACQFGKYDTFTSTGTPTLSTSKLIRSSPVVMFETVTGSRAVLGGVSPGWIRCHSFGPLPASSTSHVAGSRKKSSDTLSQLFELRSAPFTTTGSLVSGVTRSEFATSKITHGPDVAISRRSACWRASFTAAGENAM